MSAIYLIEIVPSAGLSEPYSRSGLPLPAEIQFIRPYATSRADLFTLSFDVALSGDYVRDLNYSPITEFEQQVGLTSRDGERVLGLFLFPGDRVNVYISRGKDEPHE